MKPNDQQATTQHRVKAVKSPNIPGNWRPACTCGWRGRAHGGTGARYAAIDKAWEHKLDMEDAERGAAL